jgi:hypothetical protein
MHASPRFAHVLDSPSLFLFLRSDATPPHNGMTLLKIFLWAAAGSWPRYIVYYYVSASR